ncbi:cupin domain-containing protein [Mesorhizobium sp. Z1-4]|uniref:cupin domain-containing protein n=1 Tax=Mesorhizobium sp. Z1-4 TaxID=2448478 RepID=UPI000FD94A88|nr:cupin domain-containing protein [Mesorhizobium sp. Z1-4]
MPIIRAGNAPLETGEGSSLNDELGTYRASLLSDAGGLTQFGAFVETLSPGSRSSRKHWHEREDEFVYVLDGEVTLHEGDSETVMGPGDAATFKAGVEAGHCLENRSGREVSYLVVGTRSPDDVVHYTDRDLLLVKSGGQRKWTDRNGQPAEPD